MHPIFAGRLRLPAYLLAWLVTGALLALLLSRLEPQPFAGALAFMAPLALLFGFISLSAWWLVKACPIGRTPPSRLGAYVFGASVQAGIAWVLAGALWGSLLGSRFEVPGAGADAAAGFLRYPAFLALAGMVLYLQSVVLHYVWQALDTARAAERRVLETQVTAREAELRALRSQLHPHFLFNSLNSIASLTGRDPEAARRMCGLLGEFLRMNLRLGARDRVLLSEELALAARYLDIEAVRFGARLAVETDVEADAARCLVPPLILQPLVENAVKHGVANAVDGGLIRIRARRRGALLELGIENPRDEAAPASRGQGLGLQNVRRRLAALDPERTRVEIDGGGDRFRVTLALPAEEEGGHDDGR